MLIAHDLNVLQPQSVNMEKQNNFQVFKYKDCSNASHVFRNSIGENRGKIPISHTIHERLEDANNRARIVDWEVYTVSGKTGKACLVTLIDKYSRFLKIQKVGVKNSKLVIEAMVKMLEPLTKHTLIPDRGKEFTYQQKLNNQLKIEVYFPSPQAPWQRGANKNTNGLLREYFSKGRNLTLVDDQTIQLWEDKLNNRPRKCLN